MRYQFMTHNPACGMNWNGAAGNACRSCGSDPVLHSVHGGGPGNRFYSGRRPQAVQRLAHDIMNYTSGKAVRLMTHVKSLRVHERRTPALIPCRPGRSQFRSAPCRAGPDPSMIGSRMQCRDGWPRDRLETGRSNVRSLSTLSPASIVLRRIPKIRSQAEFRILVQPQAPIPSLTLLGYEISAPFHPKRP